MLDIHIAHTKQRVDIFLHSQVLVLPIRFSEEPKLTTILLFLIVSRDNFFFVYYRQGLNTLFHVSGVISWKILTLPAPEPIVTY